MDMIQDHLVKCNVATNAIICKKIEYTFRSRIQLFQLRFARKEDPSGNTESFIS